MSNLSLGVARGKRDDEFYTSLEDALAEFDAHADAFRGRSVHCDCDDPYESQIVKALLLRFNEYGLERVETSNFSGAYENMRQAGLFDEPDDPHVPWHATVTNVPAGWDGNMEELFDSAGNTLERLQGDGDFASDECRRISRRCGLVVTNPPFSLFSRFVDVMRDLNVDWLALAPLHATQYRNVLPWLVRDRANIGPTRPSRFMTPDGRTARMGNLCWMTTLPYVPAGRRIPLVPYDPDMFPDFDGFDAVCCDTSTSLPDTGRVVGAPISVLTSLDMDRWRIVGTTGRYGRPAGMPAASMKACVDGAERFRRVLIQRRNDGMGA